MDIWKLPCIPFLQLKAYSCVFFSFQLWLTDLEILATIIAAIIHDFEHTGTTNNFHINTRYVLEKGVKPIVKELIILIIILFYCLYASLLLIKVVCLIKCSIFLLYLMTLYKVLIQFLIVKDLNLLSTC